MVFALVREFVRGRRLESLEAWEAESIGPKLRPRIEAVVVAVNSRNVYFWGGLENLLRVTESGGIRFGDLIGWERGEQDTDAMKRYQKKQLEYSLMLCYLIPKEYK
jgi:hypothetical protein